MAARNAEQVAAAVRFAREHNLRLVVKGRGHSYQGTSNTADSLLIWTRYMQDVVLQDRFVPQQCKSLMPPQRAVTVGSGAYWLQAYWGDNHARLARIKQTYDPDGLFYVHNGVGSEAWSDNGFTRPSARQERS